MTAIKNPFLIQDVAAGRGYGSARPSAAPLFLIHDASGNIVSYLKLGSLGGARRVYGISDPRFGHEGGAWLSVNELARHYIKLVKKVTLRGNILLGGWSFGGIIAIQMAHMLAAEGRGLVCSGLVLINTIYLSPSRSLGSGANSNLAPSMPASVTPDTRDEILVSLVRAHMLCSSWPPPSWARRRVPHAVLIKAADSIPVRPGSIEEDGKAALCRLDAQRHQTDLGWGETQPGLVTAVIDTPGHHYALFADENVYMVHDRIAQASPQPAGGRTLAMTDDGRGNSTRGVVSEEYSDKSDAASSEKDNLLSDHHCQHQQCISRGDSWERSSSKRTSRQKISRIVFADSVFWIQWAIIVCLAISTCALAAQRRACIAGPVMMPATAPTRSTIEPLVPDHVTAAQEPLNYGYYVPEPIPYDIFSNVLLMEQRLAELEYANVGTGVKANGRYGVYVDKSGRQRFLYPKLTINNTEAYVISGLHQMHCMMETLRDYGLLVNGFRPLWNDHHVIHCFNKWYRSIACSADSTAEGYQEPFGSVPMSEVHRASWASSVPRCRDFGALVRWAEDPAHALPFHYDSGLNVTDVSRLPGECDLTRCRNGGGWKGLD
ncbi:Putative mycotoxin biosynthesis protein UstYa [Colletotrichum destructivum]|uniref:Mycotoxin biosynthesis protein UstYa n=1 Tax=Colletotrichum destructivum TaxID=34406 RepID=A0AAX4IMT2_9PEZI|nr:Putative mycotoxin biosynthesis protein UstYa [Colletotrichum destructivum]